MKVEPGNLVKLIINNDISPESLTLLPRSGSSVILYENIDLSTFPSYKDFKGYSKKFRDETFLVISKVGRPWSFSGLEQWELYEVYEILYCNLTFHCFGHCLKSVN
mgnify:CR=1 FL=1